MKTRWLQVLALLSAGGLFLQDVAICQSQQTEAQRKEFEEITAKAEKGDVDAQYNLGLMYGTGRGVEKDYAAAMKWWLKAAKQEFAGAQYSLGVMYGSGQGVEKDYAEALKWYRKAAEQRYAYAQFNLGVMYRHGQGVEQDYVEALKWYRKAAEQGLADAQFNLGVMYENGRGVEQDNAEALKWYLKAAEQGYSAAQISLGLMYANGQGVDKDYVEAVKWYRKAAEQGYSAAQTNLGALYANGYGVEKDYVEAYAWYNLAAKTIEDAAKNRSTLERQMTPQQVAEAQKRTKELRALIEARSQSSPSDGSSFSKAQASELTPSATGTGFFISEDGYLVTNAHVVKEGSPVRLLTANGLLSARVVKVDAGNDLAVLKAEGQFAALPVAPSRGVKLGATAATVGFPNIGLQGFSPKLAKGEIASLAGAQDDPRHFQISAAIQPGNSGGALVDERGNVIGVVVAKLSQKAALATSGTLAENVNYAVKSSFLLGFLESLPDVAARLKEPNTRDRKFEDVVKDVERATVLVLVY